MNIAILGYGVEGESAYRYYRAKYPDAIFTAYDNKPEPKNPLPSDVRFVGNREDFKGITADIAIKTPPIAPWNVDVTGTVTSITREFIKNCPAPIIGVTGTKGKGTTASLIRSILDAAGKKTWLVGNIGIGALDVLDQIQSEDIVVYELSSFQLWDCDVSPHVAVVLGIEPEHLDVHRDFDDYVRAKANIGRHQSNKDTLVYNAENQWSTYASTLSPGKKVTYKSANGVHVENEFIVDGDIQICPVSALQIPGNHNVENACAAIAATREWVTDSSIIQEGLANFKGLPYRIERIREVDDVEYYNDSYSTSPPATRVALHALHSPIILIAGGYDRGADYREFSSYLAEESKIKKILLIGQTSPKIAEHISTEKYEILPDLEQAVKNAHEIAESGDTVLFSPGCASFDMFKDFNDRGRKFTELVENL